MSRLLDAIIPFLPIADVPEEMIRTYLPGNTCLNHCDTIDLVFQRVYTRNNCTYLDPGFRTIVPLEQNTSFVS